MRDHRYVDELSLKELEAVVRLRRRQQRLTLLDDSRSASDPLSRGTAQATTGERGAAGIQPVADLWPTAPDGAASSRYSAVIETGRQTRVRRPIKWRWIRDQALLIVEVLAVVGLLGVVLRMAGTVERVNEESRELQTPPTAIPTPMIGVFVLPGGHTPPDEQYQSEPAPIPAHLKGLVAAVTPLPVPTPGAEHALRITIPSLGVDAPIVAGDDWESLKKGAGHHIGSANPGERGNAVISGHNDIYGEVFRDLPDLTVGDDIVVHTLTSSYRYVVEQTRIVEPTDVSVMDATSTPVLTLISCYPYRVDTHRIVVIASLAVD
ncbi:MAG: class D sortase [Anaerolineae bacterium]|nr:class D sortase [Anaerolineae bacterium]